MTAMSAALVPPLGHLLRAGVRVPDATRCLAACRAIAVAPALSTVATLLSVADRLLARKLCEDLGRKHEKME